MIHRLSKLGVSVPAIYFVDLEASKIYMEYIRGISVKQYLWNEPLNSGRRTFPLTSVDTNHVILFLLLTFLMCVRMHLQIKRSLRQRLGARWA